MIEFDSETHTYRSEGRVIPSVTQVMQAVNIIDSSYYTDFGATRGTYVHKAVNLRALGKLDENSLDEHTEPYLCQYDKFVKETGFQVLSSEQPVSYRHGAVDKILYCGTYDLIGILNGHDVLIDVKTNNTPKWAGVQTWAYLKAVQSMPESKHQPTKRFALTLKDNRYQLKKFDGDFYDNMVWNAALTLYNFNT